MGKKKGEGNPSPEVESRRSEGQLDTEPRRAAALEIITHLGARIPADVVGGD